MWGFVGLILIVMFFIGLVNLVKELRLRGVLIVGVCIFLYWGLFQLPDILPRWALLTVTVILGIAWGSLVLALFYYLITELPNFIKKIW